jgi:hypothetical protein
MRKPSAEVRNVRLHKGLFEAESGIYQYETRYQPDQLLGPS